MSTDDLEVSVPVFGNCCLNLATDSDGVSDALAEADALVDADSDALAEADSDADWLAEVLADWLALVDAD